MFNSLGGVETSSTTLTYVCWILVCHPEIMAKLREEVDPLMVGPEGRRHLPDISVVNKLPFVNAFFMESKF